MVENVVKSCLACQASCPTGSREPLLPTPLPPAAWHSLAIDFAGPFPSGDYVLVVLDEYSRYPEVEVVSSTSARIVLPKLEAIFSRQGIPVNVKTDNGPPFNSREFTSFMNDFGIHHRKITPLWPEANGTAERFMASLNKHVRASSAVSLNWKNELQTFLRLYRGTPHTSTGTSPFEALTGRKMNIGLPSPTTSPTPTPLPICIAQRDSASKHKMCSYADMRRHTKPSKIQLGDFVLVRQPKKNKLTPPYSPLPYVVTQKKGSMVTARRGHGTTITRNSSHFKPVQGLPLSSLEDDEDDEEEDSVIANTGAEAADNGQHCSYPDSAATTKAQPSFTAVSSPSRSPVLTPKTTVLNRSPERHAPGQRSRPQRHRHPPAYLKDYQT